MTKIDLSTPSVGKHYKYVHYQKQWYVYEVEKRDTSKVPKCAGYSWAFNPKAGNAKPIGSPGWTKGQLKKYLAETYPDDDFTRAIVIHESVYRRKRGNGSRPRKGWRQRDYRRTKDSW